MRGVELLVAFGVLSVSASSLSAQSFHELGLLPSTTFAEAKDVDAGGTVVIGTCTAPIPNYRSRAFRWTLGGGVQEVPVYASSANASGVAVSANGNSISGVNDPIVSSSGNGSFIWSPGTATRVISAFGYSLYGIAGLSADGTQFIGGFHGSIPGGPSMNYAVYVGQLGAEVLPPLFANAGSFVTDMTPSGSIAVGQTSGFGVRWYRSQGAWVVEYLGSARVGSSTYAIAISADGSTIIGNDVLSNSRVFRWTAGGIQGLGTITGVTTLRAAGVSGDGSRIVANGQGTGGDRALYWRSGIGWVDLTSHAIAQNIPIGARILRYAYGISDDGNAIVGRTDGGRAYVLYLGPEPTPVPAGIATVGAGCPGPHGTPTFSAPAGALPWLGTTFVGRIDSIGPTAITIIAIGFSDTLWGSTALPLDLAPLGMPSCSLAVSIDMSEFLPNLGGYSQWAVPLPPSTALVGAAVYVQPIVTSPGTNPFGFVLGDAAELLLGWY